MFSAQLTIKLRDLRHCCPLDGPVFWSYDPDHPCEMVINGVTLEFTKPVWKVIPLSLLTGIDGNCYIDPWRVVRERMLPIVGDVRMEFCLNTDGSADFVWGDRLVHYKGRFKFGKYLDALAGIVEDPTAELPKGFDLFKADRRSEDGRPLFTWVRLDPWEVTRPAYYDFKPLDIGQPIPQSPSDTLWKLWFVFDTLGNLPSKWDSSLTFLFDSLVFQGPILPGYLDKYFDDNNPYMRRIPADEAAVP